MQDDSSGDDDNDSCSGADNLTNNALRRRSKRRLSKGLVCLCSGFLCLKCWRLQICSYGDIEIQALRKEIFAWNKDFGTLIDVHFVKHGF